MYEWAIEIDGMKVANGYSNTKYAAASMAQMYLAQYAEDDGETLVFTIQRERGAEIVARTEF